MSRKITSRRLNGRRAASLAVALFAAAAAAGAPSQPVTMGKRALLVAVSDYRAPYPTRKVKDAWPSLNSDLDVDNMRQVLVSRYGFRDEDVLVLRDLKASRSGKQVPGAATREGILGAFRTWLIDPAQPGDVSVFLYSGHGQQVRDQDDDEPDGLDEALVPYDFVSARAADNAGRVIRDDDLGKLLRELSFRLKGEGSTLCVVDCCHAGTATRGSLSAKGRGWDARVDGALPSPARGRTDSGLLPEARGWAAFSACQSHESAFEAQLDHLP
jgi:metacaspase-1